MSRERELLAEWLQRARQEHTGFHLSGHSVECPLCNLEDRTESLLAEPEGDAQELDAVETLFDRTGTDPETGASVYVTAGSRGAVITALIEVEFSGDDGKPWAFAAYSPDEVRTVYRPEPPEEEA